MDVGDIVITKRMYDNNDFSRPAVVTGIYAATEKAQLEFWDPTLRRMCKVYNRIPFSTLIVIGR